MKTHEEIRVLEGGVARVHLVQPKPDPAPHLPHRLSLHIPVNLGLRAPLTTLTRLVRIRINPLNEDTCHCFVMEEEKQDIAG